MYLQSNANQNKSNQQQQISDRQRLKTKQSGTRYKNISVHYIYK